MLSRRHLRIKVLQALYAFFLSENKDLKNGEKVLLLSMEKLHELYVTQLSLLLRIHAFASDRMEEAKLKYFPTPEELNPNLRFINNRFLLMLAENRDLQKHIDHYKISWHLDLELVRKLFLQIRDGDDYKEYLSSPEGNWDSDVEFIGKIVKKVIGESELLPDYFEDRNIFWSGDYHISLLMLFKTLKHFPGNAPPDHPLPTLLKTDGQEDNEDLEFMLTIFRKTILHSEEYTALIAPKASNWEVERIAVIDMILMKMALCELFEFPSIPIKVTMDEYIEIAKYFSTPKSSQFINGVLDKLVLQLKAEKKIVKRGRGLME